MYIRRVLPKLAFFFTALVVLSSLLGYSTGAKAGSELPEYSSGNSNVAFVSSQIGGSFGEMFVQNQIAYLGIGKNLVILNISNLPFHFVEGTLKDFSGDIAGIFVDQTRAYVTDYDRLWIVDVSSASTPQILGYFKPAQGCGAVAAQGNFAYALCRTTLYAVNVSDPAHPAVSGSFDIPDSGIWVKSIKIDGNYAYIANYREGLEIVDISDPARMKAAGVGSGDSFGQVNDVYVARKNDRVIAYMVSPEKGLFSADVTDPAKIQRNGSLYSIGWPARLYVQGNYAYVANQDHGLWIVNVENLNNPFSVSSFLTDGMAFHVFLDGSTALVNNYSGGLQFIDVQDAINPKEIAFYEEPVWINHVVVKGNVAYTVGEKGLALYNVIDPYNLKFLSLYAAKDTTTVEIAGERAYLGVGPGKFEIVDVQTSKLPNRIGEYQITSMVSSIPQCAPPPPSLPQPPHIPGIVDIFIEGQYAYLANSEAGLRILDISDTGSIKEKAVFKDPRWVHIDGVYKEGSLAYVLDGGCLGLPGGLSVVDLSDMDHPAVIGFTPLPSWGSDLEVRGSYAYVSSGANGFFVVSLANPDQPVVVATLAVEQAGDAFIDADLHGHLAYLAVSSGLRVVDVTNPGSPTVLGSYQIDGAYGVYHQGCVSYIAQWGYGMTLVGYQGNGESCMVSGHVQDANGNPVSGVQLTINPSQSGSAVQSMSTTGISVTTDQNGNYAIPGLFTHQYDLAPFTQGKAFSPSKRQIKVATDITNQNFVMVEQSYIFLPFIGRKQ